MAEGNIAGHTNLSDEDPTRMCDPCKFRGVNTQAGTFCQVCSEYLCDTCEEVHRSLRATRDHELKSFGVLKRRSIKQKSLISSIMTCTVHDAETLTLFCLSHGVAICDRCSSIKHRRCEVKGLREVVREANVKTEVELFLEKIRSLSTEIIELKDLREKDKQHIMNYCEETKGNVIELKRKVIAWIEELAKDMEDNICDIEEKLTSEAENDIKSTNEMSDQLKETINHFDCLGNDDEEVAFVLMNKEKHKFDEGKEAKDDIMKEIKPIKLEFHKSEKLATLMSEVTSMGTLKTDNPSIGVQQIPTDDSRICFPQISSLTRRDITIGSTRGVTGCLFMTDGRLIVCEGNGSQRVKVFSVDFKIQSEIKIASVWDVAVVSENKVIVSQRQGKCLQFLNISGAITKAKAIPVGMNCYGVYYNYDRIYVSCHDTTGQGGTVKILTMTGDTVNTFNNRQGYPYSLAVNSVGDRIVVSTVCVQCYDNTGTTLFTYSDSQLSGNLGVLFDSYNNFIVCGQRSNNLHVVNSDGTRQKILLTSEDRIDNPYCLAYRPSDKTLVIGQLGSSQLVFKVN